MTSKETKKKTKEKMKRHRLKGQYEILNKTYDTKEYDGFGTEETDDEF